ncbi:MAG: hypothetical protein DU429_04230 [Candidatus Tokpelaia sp.]|nr:MAG: hypothetical protein DU430_06145 [Candidatus Tokpelaia sp.]KAA6207057.1 MAG: hypothetical protein DU429_04230 [Candidatus Tokpelaia sp.]KAA6405403.1 hypothetical protein DPQ22_04910 [Candidatus Tokpelaia sp.]
MCNFQAASDKIFGAAFRVRYRIARAPIKQFAVIITDKFIYIFSFTHKPDNISYNYRNILLLSKYYSYYQYIYLYKIFILSV